MTEGRAVFLLLIDDKYYSIARNHRTRGEKCNNKRHMKRGRAPGAEFLPMELLKEETNILFELLAHVFNRFSENTTYRLNTPLPTSITSLSIWEYH